MHILDESILTREDLNELAKAIHNSYCNEADEYGRKNQTTRPCET